MVYKNSLSTIILCALVFGFCGCSRVPDYPFLWRYPIVEKTKEQTTRLLSVHKDMVEQPEIVGEFYLYYKTVSYGKKSDWTYMTTWIIHSVPNEESYKIRSMLTSDTFYEKGENIGHAEPNGEWSNWIYGKNDLLEFLLEKVDK